MKSEKEIEQNVQVKITLTQSEFDMLKRLAEYENKPLASVFMKFVRDANMFVVIKQMLATLDKLERARKGIKGLFSRDLKATE